MLFSLSVNSVFAKYAIFAGRARRSEFWYFILFQLVVCAIFLSLGFFFRTASSATPGWIAAATGIYYVATLVPAIAVAVRRLHDIDKGGEWILTGLIPIVGQIWLVALMLHPSDHNDNRFGPSDD